MTEPQIWMVLGLLYFLPALIAYHRKHKSAHAILALTAILGWTGLGWVVALVWSFTGNVRAAQQAL